MHMQGVSLALCHSQNMSRPPGSGWPAGWGCSACCHYHWLISQPCCNPPALPHLVGPWRWWFLPYRHQYPKPFWNVFEQKGKMSWSVRLPSAREEQISIIITESKTKLHLNSLFLILQKQTFFHSALHIIKMKWEPLCTHPPALVPSILNTSHLCGHFHCLASLCSSTSWTLRSFPQGCKPLQTLIAEATLAQSGETQVFSAQEVSHFNPGGICLDNCCHKTNRARLCLEGLGPCGSTTELHDPGRSLKCDSPGGRTVLPSTDSHLFYAESIVPFLITSEGGLCLTISLSSGSKSQ